METNNNTELERMFEDWAKATEAQDWEKASAALNCIWMLFHMMITPITNPELKELTFFKVPITMGNGGKYVLALTHVEGPKIRFDEDNVALTDVKKQERI